MKTDCLPTVQFEIRKGAPAVTLEDEREGIHNAVSSSPIANLVSWANNDLRSGGDPGRER